MEAERQSHNTEVQVGEGGRCGRLGTAQLAMAIIQASFSRPVRLSNNVGIPQIMRFLSGECDISRMSPFFNRYRLKTSLSFTVESTVILDPQKARLSRNPSVFGCKHFALRRDSSSHGGSYSRPPEAPDLGREPRTHLLTPVLILSSQGTLLRTMNKESHSFG